MSGRLERLFDRYRKEGDPRLLAEVFDRTWLDLLRVALHLAVDPAEAEDLVQETFLRALESAGRYDPARPLRPWLVGILSNRARELVRGRRRGPLEPEESWTDGPAGSSAAPETELEARELAGGVARALAGLPELYRTVLYLRLRSGLRTRDIARVLERPHATVRTQVKRGLELLRRALPPGIALPAVLALPAPRGVHVVRAELLRRAALPSGRAAVPLAAGSLVTTGGLLVSHKLLLGSAALAALVAGTLLVRSAVRPGAVRPEARAAVEPERAALVAPERVPGGAAAAVAAPERRELPGAGAPEELAAASGPAALSVRVRWSGGERPAPGVSLRLLPASEPEDALGYRRALADEHGQARFEGLAPGEYTALSDRGGRATATLAAGEEESVVLEVASGPELVGRVVDEEGLPVPRASVWLAADWSFRFEGEQLVPACIDDAPAARTGADGRFAIPSMGEARYCGAWAEGYAPSDDLWLEAGEDATCEVEIVLPRNGARLDGLVVDPEGEPVEGATVILDVGLLREDNPDGSGVFRNSRHVATRSRADGTFAFPSVKPGEKELVVRAPGFAPFSEDVVFEPERRHEVVARLEPGALVRGHVVDPAGAPLAGVSVRLVPQGYASVSNPGFAAWTRTGADGAFLLDGCRPGEASLALDGGERGRSTEEVRLAPGEELALELVLGTELSLAGRVLDEGRRPLAGLEAALAGPDGAPWGEATTDAEGGFLFANLAPATYELTLREDGAEVGRRFHLAPSDEEAVLVLSPEERPSARLAGGLAGREEGLEEDLDLALRSSSMDRGRTLGLVDQGGGRFESEPFVPGTYRAELRTGDSPRAWLGEVTVSPGQTLDLGWIEVPEPGRVAVRLRKGAERPRQLVRVRVDDAAGNLVWDYLLFEWVPDEPLDFSLPPGSYRLHLWGADLVPASSSFEVAAGKTTETELELRQGCSFKLSFDLPAGVPPPRFVELVVRDERGAEVFRLTLDDELWSDWRTYLALRPGAYSLSGRTDTGLAGELELSLSGAEPAVPAPTLVLR